MIGGTLAGLAAFILLIDNITFDTELHASETRQLEVVAQAKAEAETSDRQIIESIHAQITLALAQQRAQYLTLRQDALKESIERLTDKLITLPEHEHYWVQSRIDDLQEKLDDIERQLEAHILGGTP